MHAQTSLLKRLAVGFLLAFAFLFMASVFVPDWTRADEPPPGMARPLTPSELPIDHAAPSAANEVDAQDAHPMLGTVESRNYLVRIYAANPEPLYSIYESETGDALGLLLTAEEVAYRLPELKLEHLDFRAPQHLMLHMARELPVAD